MAHVEKYVRTSVPHMVAHYERRKDEHGEYIKFANQNIDLSKTEQNYNLGPQRPCGQAEFIQKRCQELNAAKRKDLNVLADWIVTAPPSVIEAKMTDKFLAETYNFLADRYEVENVVSCYVHLDEVTPHLHFAFVPVTKDGRVSARDRLCRYDLSTFHKDLDTLTVWRRSWALRRRLFLTLRKRKNYTLPLICSTSRKPFGVSLRWRRSNA